METGTGWKQFKDKETPSTVDIDKSFFENVPKGRNILDFGCAWGRIGFQLQKLGYKVSGFDINENTIEYALKKAEKTNPKYPEKLEFITANALKLPYMDGSFDVCIMQAFLTTIISQDVRKKIIQEANRVLNEDGILYLADFGQNWKDPVYRKRYLKDYSLTGEKGTFIVTEDGKPESKELFQAHHYSPSELRDLLNDVFEIKIFKETVFKTFHGNHTLGYIIVAKKAV
jgi:ubiquinone/menaquinone biosynthesis C-methylase UbiE